MKETKEKSSIEVTLRGKRGKRGKKGKRGKRGKKGKKTKHRKAVSSRPISGIKCPKSTLTLC
jgi:hypothetical protein